MLATAFDELFVDREALGDDENRNVELGYRLKAIQTLQRIESLEVCSFALADDLHATRLDVGVVACERKTGLLNPRVSDRIA